MKWNNEEDHKVIEVLFFEKVKNLKPFHCVCSVEKPKDGEADGQDQVQ